MCLVAAGWFVAPKKKARARRAHGDTSTTVCSHAPVYVIHVMYSESY